MNTTSTAPEKWAKPAMTPTVEAYHSHLRRIVAERWAASGKSWNDAVVDRDLELRTEDFEAVEHALLDTGYRFEMSAQVSLTEAPDKYRAPEGIADSGSSETDDDGHRIVGTGANVFAVSGDVVGTARLVSTVEAVLQMLTEGVPEGTIAVIDDSGGTLTAPILEHFTGVLCMGGTVRSHLGILTREYGVPCLMDVQLDGLQDGDRVKVEYSKAPADVYTENDTSTRARVVVLNGETDAI